MNRVKIVFLLLIIGLSTPTYSQSSDSNTGQNEEDSASIARRKDYEERLNKLREYERRRQADPEKFKDSIRQYREQRSYQEALERINEYQNDKNLSNLKEIDLSNARLDAIPEFVYSAVNMEVLVLDGNRITQLPDRLNQLNKLKRIYWRNSNLGSQKVKVARLSGIEKLDLSGNGLTKLPRIHRIKGIEELVLEENEFKKIPLWRVRKLKSIKELELSQNPVILDKRWYGLIDHVKILKLNKCNISSIHPSLYRMKGVEELQIQVNKLQTLPEGISELNQLTKLSFYKNELDSLPSDLFDLNNLEVIDLYYNKLQVIPSDISKLKNLRILYLSFNELYDIPGEIGDLSLLRELYIHHNRISEIPSSISGLDSLRVLHFQNNYVPQFPEHLLTMNNLKDLDISNTSIQDLPSGLEQMNLKSFYWRELDINLNHHDRVETRDLILKMMENGVRVSPRIVTDKQSD